MIEQGLSVYRHTRHPKIGHEFQMIAQHLRQTRLIFSNMYV